MATTNLLPDSTVSNNWTINGGSGTVHQNLADTSDLSDIRTQDQSRVAVVELADYSAGGTIDSIRHYVRGYKFHSRSGDIEIQVKITNSSDTTLYSDNHLLLVNGYNPQDFYGTARTTSDGSSAWTDGDLDGLRLDINTSPEDPDGVSYAVIVKAYVEVTYTGVAVTDNAIFFGHNF